QQIDGGVFQNDFSGTVLELELRGDSHEIAHATAGEEIESFGLERRFIRQTVDLFPACVRFGIAADGRSAHQVREIGLVECAAADEGTTDRIALEGVDLCSRGTGHGGKRETGVYERSHDGSRSAISITPASTRTRKRRSGCSAGPRSTAPLRS